MASTREIAAIRAKKYVPLPSSDSARDVIEGVPGAALKATSHLLGRATLIALGMYVVGGERNAETIAKGSLGGAVMIEAFALGWFAFQR